MDFPIRRPASCLLVLLVVLTTCAFGQVRDRRLVGLRFERSASNLGRVDVYAQFRVMTNDPVGVNLGFGMRLYRGAIGNLGPQIGGTTPITFVRQSAADCEQQNAYVDCSGGACPNELIGGVMTPGTCVTIEVDQIGGYSLFYCDCVYKAERKIGDEVKVAPGEKLTAQIVLSAAMGHAPDTVGFPANDQITATCGSRADEASFGFAGRLPSPINGQGNSAQASLTLSLVPQGEGPYEYWGVPGSAVTLTHDGAPGAPLTLMVGDPTLDAIPALVDISVDLEVQSACAIYDGIPFGWMCTTFLGLNPTAPHTAVFSLPPSFPGGTVSLQGFVLDPTAFHCVWATARHTIGIQSAPTLPPDLPPLSGMTPFPFARDAIVPNHGPVASASGARDGTLHSVVGRRFDAVTPSNTTASVNGIPVEIFVVRPNEILFRLNAAHEAGIGGPLVVTSTGGVSPTIADQMETWVFATPPVTEIKQETTTPMGPLRGAFSLQGGLKGATGVLPNGAQHDWYMEALPSGTQVRGFVGQLDVNNQLVVRCATSATGAQCYPLTSGQTGSQMPVNPPGIEDLILSHGNYQTTTFFGLQDDGGPGSSPFAGMSGIPASATVSSDPDGPFVMGGGTDMVAVSGAGVGGAGPFSYLLLVAWP